jgi:protocatechuate 3,4-dioxygenase beta subunit
MNDRDQTYEGRSLPRPHDEIVDQGLGFDIGTLHSRRRALRFLGLGAAVAGLTACSTGSDGSSASTTTTTTTTGSASTSSGGTAVAGEIPDETAGPYPGDGSNGPDVLSQSGIVRGDIRSSFGDSSGTAEGVPMTLGLTITDLEKNAAFEGVAVYVWHCTREGAYSMYSEGVEDQNYLRGVQIAGADGKVSFTSIFPACYSGRWPHIHFEVYPDQASISDAGNAIATSQVALPQDACDTVYAQRGYEQSVQTMSQVSLDDDNVFGDDGGKSQLATVTGDASSGYTVALAVGVDTSTEPRGGGGAPPSR